MRQLPLLRLLQVGQHGAGRCYGRPKAVAPEPVETGGAEVLVQAPAGVVLGELPAGPTRDETAPVQFPEGGVALLTGFVAKEIVVSTLGVLYAVDNNAEPDALEKALASSSLTPLTAFTMMVFVLLYLPCLATVAAIRRETGSYKWMTFSIVYTTSVAWVVSFIVYQGGRILGYA